MTGALTIAGALLGRGAMVAFIDVGSLCIAVAFLGVSLSARKLRASRPDMHRPYRMPLPGLVPWVAALGACSILGVMVVPGSPAALVWPLEWGILAAVLALGVLLWLTGRRGRAAIDEPTRARLVLGEFAD